MSNPIQFPVKLAGFKEDGSDAHVVDRADNVVVDGAEWKDKSVGAEAHREAMQYIADAINSYRMRIPSPVPPPAPIRHEGRFVEPRRTEHPTFH
jgi:hypothetical protein